MTDGPLRYPIYIPSYRRAGRARLPALLAAAGVPYALVVRPEEAAAYAGAYPAAGIVKLPPAYVGSLDLAREGIRAVAAAGPAARHWQLDDDIRQFLCWTDGKRHPCAPAQALTAVEAFADQYANVAVAGPVFSMWAFRPSHRYRVNRPVSCAFLIDNRLPCRFRGPCYEDLDFALQALAAGYCTVVLQTVQYVMKADMASAGGMESVYRASDGRLRQARDLERRWPGIVTTQRTRGLPRPRVAWDRFTTPLQPRALVPTEVS